MTAYTPQCAVEWNLREYLFRRDGYVTVESVVSGPGLRNVYEYLTSERERLKNTPCSTNTSPPPLPSHPPTSKQLKKTTPPIQHCITQQALTGNDPLCTRTVDIVLRNYGAVARAMALRWLPRGGMYLAGGIAPKLVERLSVLTDVYLGDALMGDLVASFPLYLCVNESLGLLGARVRAVRLLDT